MVITEQREVVIYNQRVFIPVTTGKNTRRCGRQSTKQFMKITPSRLNSSLMSLFKSVILLPMNHRKFQIS